MTLPLVSVIIPVYNCRTVVAGALASVFEQTLPADQVEVIAVDDGSTDGSAELLDELARAHEQLTVVHQPNSGGAGAPRNRGLERATGRFVFFLDADDRLGPEALERMTAMAERNDTDIVLGKQVGVGGRKIPRGLFDATIERTHVLDTNSDLFGRMSMAALQLFRRSLIEDAGLRFTEGILSHEDQLFTAGAYLRARGVSVLADYDCYYWTAREDGSSSTQTGGAAPTDVYAITARAMRQVADHTEPGEARERLHHRYLRLEVFSRLERLYLDSSADDRKVTLAGCCELLAEWYTADLLDRSNPSHRLLAHCVLNHLDDELETVLHHRRAGERPRLHLEDGRAFLKYPFFRDAAVGVPDACYETPPPPLRLRHDLTRLAWDGDALRIEGTIVFPDVDEGVAAAHLILESASGAHRRVACEVVAGPPPDEGMSAAYTAALRPASEPPLADGDWTIVLEAAVEGHLQTSPLVKPRAVPFPSVAGLVTAPPARDRAPGAPGGVRVARTLPKRGRGEVVLQMGGGLVPADFGDVEVGWGPRNRLRVRAAAPPVLGTGPAPVIEVVLRHTGVTGAAIRATLGADPDDPSRRSAYLSLARARVGRWQAHFEVEGLDEPVPVRLPEGSGVLGPVTTSIAPPRRGHVPLDRRTLSVHITAPLAARAHRARRRRDPGEKPAKSQ